MEAQLEVNISLSFQTFGAGIRTPRASGRHIDRRVPFYVLLYVQQGLLPVQEEERAFEVGAGQTLLLWPARRHWGTADFSPDLRLYWLHFAPCEGRELSQEEGTLQVPQLATVARPEILEAYFRRFLDDSATGRLMPVYASLLTGLMLQEVADARPLAREARSGAAAADRARTYIRSHLNRPLTAARIAHELNYNPDYLNRVFHQTYAHTLTQEIHRSRVGHARHLLLHSTLNVTEIALAVGFSSFSTFNRVFKHYEGMSAQAFRRLNAQADVNLD